MLSIILFLLYPKVMEGVNRGIQRGFSRVDPELLDACGQANSI